MTSVGKKLSRAEEEAEERALQKLNRMIAKAAPLAARQRKQAMKRFMRAIAEEIGRTRRG